LSILGILFYAPFWILGGLSKRRRRPAERAMRLWPLLAVLSLAAFLVIIIASAPDLIVRLGNLTAWSAGAFLATIFFAVATLASAVAWWRAPAEGTRRSVRTFSFIVTFALLIMVAYFAYWGVIGLRTWA